MERHGGLSYYSPGRFLTFIPNFWILQLQSNVGEWHREDTKIKENVPQSRKEVISKCFTH